MYILRKKENIQIIFESRLLAEVKEFFNNDALAICIEIFLSLRIFSLCAHSRRKCVIRTSAFTLANCLQFPILNKSTGGNSIKAVRFRCKDIPLLSIRQKGLEIPFR